MKTHVHIVEEGEREKTHIDGQFKHLTRAVQEANDGASNATLDLLSDKAYINSLYDYDSGRLHDEY